MSLCNHPGWSKGVSATFHEIYLSIGTLLKEAKCSFNYQSGDTVSITIIYVTGSLGGKKEKLARFSMALHCHMKQKNCTQTGCSPGVTAPSPAHPEFASS